MDMEKVIKGVHDARRYLEDREWVDKSVGVHIDTLNDAIALLKEQEEEIDNLKQTAQSMMEGICLLKEQEPRILDWDEIRNYTVVYGEFRGIKDIYPLIITVDSLGRCLSWNPGINVSKEFILVVSDEEDRKNTRCWDKMPTEEQRQAVKWE